MPEESAPNVSIITVVWDRDDDSLSINYEGLNYFEAVGMLSHALTSIEYSGEVEEVDGDGQ